MAAPRFASTSRGALKGRLDALDFALQEEQLGTAHAVSCALPLLEGFDGWVQILYGDVPNLPAQALQELYELRSPEGCALLTTEVPDPHGYGRIVRQGGEVKAIVEHKECSEAQLAINEINAGVYLVHANFLRQHLKAIARSDKVGEFYLTDLVAIAAGREGARAVVWPEAQALEGVNDRAQLALAAAFAQAKINQRWLGQGIGMRDPSRTIIGPEVQLGAEVELSPGVELWGRCIIEAGAEIGTGCVLHDTLIGAKTKLGPYCVGSHVAIDPDQEVEAFTQL